MLIAIFLIVLFLALASGVLGFLFLMGGSDSAERFLGALGLIIATIFFVFGCMYGVSFLNA